MTTAPPSALVTDPTGAYAGFQAAYPHPMYAIDDVGIWSRALSAAEAESIYYTGQAGRSFDTEGPESLSLIQGPVAPGKSSGRLERSSRPRGSTGLGMR